MCFLPCSGRRRRWNDVRNEVDDQVGFDVAQDEMPSKEAVFEYFRQRRQLLQKGGRHSRQRQRGGVISVDRRRHSDRHLHEDRLLIRERPSLEILGDDAADFLGGGWREYLTLVGIGALDANRIGEGLLPPGYLFGIRGFLEAR